MAWSRGKAYGQDLRDRAFAMADDGFAVGQVAELLRVSISYVSKALSRRRRTGETAARPQCCHVGLKLAALREKIAAEIAAKPDVTIEELRRWLVAPHETTASHGLMVKTVAQLRLTHKKSPSTQPNRRVQTSLRRVQHGAKINPRWTARS
jgi:transposase